MSVPVTAAYSPGAWRWAWAAAVVLAGALWLPPPSASAQADPNAVLVDTSPPLLAGDFAALRAAAQFSLGTWLTTRESERLRQGLIAEWILCDSQGRDQILEFAATVRELAGMSEDGRDEARAQVLEGLRGARETGRPLGQALGELIAAVETPVCPAATRHDAASWIEMQEAGLVALVGAPVRIPNALGSQMAAAAAKSESDELANAPDPWAPLRVALAAAGPEAFHGALAPALRVARANAGESFEDPLELYRFSLPDGYELVPGAGGGPDTNTFALRVPGGESRVIAVATSDVPDDVGMEAGALTKALADRLASGGPCTDLVPRATDRAIAASAFVERGGRWIWVCLLRAPGDTALVSLVAICAPGDSVAMATDLAVVLRSFAFRDEVWAANAGWEIARPSAMPTDPPVVALRREAGLALAEATGLLAVRALGAPVGSHGVAIETLREALGPVQPLSLFDWPGSPL